MKAVLKSGPRLALFLSQHGARANSTPVSMSEKGRGLALAMIGVVIRANDDGVKSPHIDDRSTAITRLISPAELYQILHAVILPPLYFSLFVFKSAKIEKENRILGRVMEKSDAWILTENLHLQRGQTDPISAAFRVSRMPMVVSDPARPDNPIVFANDAFLRLTGYERQEITGRNCRFLQGPETDPEAAQKIRDAIDQGTDISIDILNYKKDGSSFWNALHVSPVPDADGKIQYFFASQHDATDRKRHEFNVLNLQRDLEIRVKSHTKELEEALRRSTLLLHEVDHRVKNNLQMISAMLTLQSMSIPDMQIKTTLQEMLERVDAMGLVHKRLYQSENIMDFDIADFTEEIAVNLVAATGRNDIDLVVDAESVTIKADQAASIALVINETITNALKHAFPRGRRGDLRVSVKPSGDVCEISIRDNGPGMPAALPQKASFGKTLIESLIQQLKATIEWLPAAPGTHVKIMLPLS